MHVCHSFDECAPCRGGIVAIGNFDGVHLGHRAMIAALLRTARARCVPAVVFTFDPHPLAILKGIVPAALTTTASKLELLAECGVDCTLVYPTDTALLDLSPQDFFDQMLVGRMQVQGLVEGSNFRFGKDRSGDVGLLQELCAKRGMSCEIVPQVEIANGVVSSSAVRALLLEGKLRDVQTLLGISYRVTGRVVAGAQRGRTIGFPTANLAEIATVLPPAGVYAGQAWVHGVAYPAGINIGPNPTFGESQQKFEVHLLDFSGDLYGQQLDVDLLDHLRAIRPFTGPQELIDQLRNDMEQVRNVLKNQ